MHPIYTRQLTLSQKQDIRTLVSACKNFEPLSLSAPSEDGLDYFLLYEKKQLVSMLFLFFPEETVCECSAFTLPSWRKKGCFSRLLEDALAQVEALEERQETEIDFCFLADQDTPSSMSALAAMGAEFWYSEYSMERSLLDVDTPVPSELSIREAEPNLYTASIQDEIIGTCVLLPSDTQVYFYGFEIKEGWRGRGYGQGFLLEMLSLLSKNGYDTVSLQVSGLNQAALALYEKTGFRITDTLSYYWY